MKYLKFFVLLCILTFSVSCGQQKKYVKYKVKQGETLKSIAKNIGVKTKDLLRLNPDIDRKPSANTIIIIPNKKNTILKNSKKDVVVVDDKNNQIKEKDSITNTNSTKAQTLEALKKNYIVYEVKKGDTFYRLTRFYNVTQTDLITRNPELSEGLKTGQIIKIKPLRKETDTDVTIYEDVIGEGISLKVALLLPFLTQENERLDAEELFPRSQLANIVTDFYLGAEMAIDSLRKKGINIALDVYDTGRNSTKLDSIVTTTNFSDTDVIIGPLYYEEAQFLSSKVSKPIVYPIYSKNQSKFKSSKLIKTSPEKEVFREELLTFIKDSVSNENIIVVGDGNYKSNASSKMIKSALESHDSIAQVHMVKPENGYIPRERFTDILKSDSKNWLLLATDDKVIVSDVINSANSLADTLQMRVFTYNKGKAFDKVDNLKLARVNFTFVSDEYVDESSLMTKTFNAQYIRKNKALPSFYATKGFDITYDVLVRLASGNSLKSTFKEGASIRVESKFDYKSKPLGVTENRGLFIVKYKKDLSLERLK